nr:GNAT family N-acetyltransferase [uncultured Halomonas sp.]
MLASFERLLRRRDAKPTAGAPASDKDAVSGLETARESDIDIFLDAARNAAALGQAPWTLRDQTQLDTLERALEFTVHHKLWLQRDNDGVQHWQGKLLALRHADAPPLGLVLACRPDDEAAWQLRFFCIDKPWQGSGHGARLLLAARRSLSGVPLRARLPLACGAAVKSLEAAGFQRMHVDAAEIATFEVSAQWD